MTASTTPIVNGIDVDNLQKAISAIKQDPANGITSWTVKSQWQDGTQHDHVVDGTTIGGKHVERKFTIKSDEPYELTGHNRYPNPQDLLFAALNACMMVGYVSSAAVMGIKLDKLEVETTGDIDLRGLFELDESVPKGYDRIRQTVRIAADASDEELRELHAAVKRTSVNYDNITRAIPVDSELVIE